MINKNEFRTALERFAADVTVIITTKEASGHLHGMTVSAFYSVFLDPLLSLICIDKYTGSRRAFEENEFFAVNILREDHRHLSVHFASICPINSATRNFTKMSEAFLS